MLLQGADGSEGKQIRSGEHRLWQAALLNQLLHGCIAARLEEVIAMNEPVHIQG
ncbi:hypothetical protein D3C80_1927350 [compost metagenome]